MSFITGDNVQHRARNVFAAGYVERAPAVPVIVQAARPFGGFGSENDCLFDAPCAEGSAIVVATDENNAISSIVTIGGGAVPLALDVDTTYAGNPFKIYRVNGIAAGVTGVRVSMDPGAIEPIMYEVRNMADAPPEAIVFVPPEFMSFVARDNIETLSLNAAVFAFWRIGSSVAANDPGYMNVASSGTVGQYATGATGAPGLRSVGLTQTLEVSVAGVLFAYAAA